MSLAHPKSKEIDQLILEHMKLAMKERIEELYERKKKEIIDRIDMEKSSVVAGVLVSMMKSSDMLVEKDRIIFTIQTKPINNA